MGIISSRTILQQRTETHSKSERHPRRHLRHIFAPYRLVRNKLRKKTQCGVSDEGTEICDSLPLLQKSSQGVQQKNVRPILQVEEDKVQGTRYYSRTTKLL